MRRHYRRKTKLSDISCHRKNPVIRWEAPRDIYSCIDTQCIHPIFKDVIDFLGSNLQMSWSGAARHFNISVQSFYSHLDKFHPTMAARHRRRSKGKPKKRNWSPFEDAKRLVAEFQERLGLYSSTTYRMAYKWRMAHNLPDNPYLVYASEWRDWNDFLGTVKRRWPSFEEAKQIVKKEAAKAGITGSVIYAKSEAWRKKFNLPVAPDKVYRNAGWAGWHDFLGKKWASFDTAKTLIQTEGASLGIKDSIIYGKARQWREKHNLPSRPHVIYADHGWSGWDDFFGRTRVDFKTAREILAKHGKSKGIRSGGTYRKDRDWLEKHNLPLYPESMYSEWKGWKDFLAYKNWPSFEEAKKIMKLYAADAGITTKALYGSATKWRYQHNLPSQPSQVYAKEWKGWDDFAGRRQNPIIRWEAPGPASLDERIAEAQRIYQETGCLLVETAPQLRAEGIGANEKTIRKWVADIRCEIPCTARECNNPLYQAAVKHLETHPEEDIKSTERKFGIGRGSLRNHVEEYHPQEAEKRRQKKSTCKPNTCTDPDYQGAVKYLQKHPEEGIQSTEIEFGIGRGALRRHVNVYHPQEVEKRRLKATCKPDICAHSEFKDVVKYLQEHPEEGVDSTAREFGIGENSLRGHVNVYHPQEAEKRRKKSTCKPDACSHPEFKDALKYLQKHPEEGIEPTEREFGFGVNSLRKHVEAYHPQEAEKRRRRATPTRSTRQSSAISTTHLTPH